MFEAGHVTTTQSPGEKTDLVRSLGLILLETTAKPNSKMATCRRRLRLWLRHDEWSKMPAVMKQGTSVVTIAGTPTADALQDAFGGKRPGLVVRLFLWMLRDKAVIANAKAAGVDWVLYAFGVNGDDLKTP